MLDDPRPIAALTEILVFARSGPAVEDLLTVFTGRAQTLLGTDRVDLRPVRHRPGSPPGAHDDPGGPGAEDARFPVSCGASPWGELHLSRRDGPLGADDVRRGRLLAEILGAALAARSESAGVVSRIRDRPVLQADDAGDEGHPCPDDMVALVTGCAEDLDRMPDASTRARLALVVGRLAAVVGSSAWSVWLAHEGRLYDVDGVAQGLPVLVDDGGGPAPAGWVPTSRFPARRRASEGAAFFADRYAGDEAERRVLADREHAAVIGAGGYDQDGRSWVVEVFAGPGTHRLEHVTAVLYAVVQAALSFPREAFVPRPMEPRVRAILGGPVLVSRAPEGHGLGEVG